MNAVQACAAIVAAVKPENTSSWLQTIVQVGTVLVALIVGLGGPALAFRYQNRLAVRATKQQWVIDFQNDVAEYVGAMYTMSSLLGISASDDGFRRYTETRERSVRVMTRIRLRLRHDDVLLMPIAAAMGAAFKAVESQTFSQDHAVAMDLAAEKLIQRAWDEISTIPPLIKWPLNRKG